MFAAGVLTDRVIKMRNKRMWAEKRNFCKRQGLVDTRKLWSILYPVLAASLFLAGCGQAADDDSMDILPERVQGDSGGQGESGKMADSGAEPEEDNADSGEFSAEYTAEGATKPDSGENMDSIAVIRPDGEEIDWAVYSEGVYCYSSVTDLWSGTGLYGYLSEDGEEITLCIYSEAAPFSEGLGCALLDGKYGYIGEDGETALPFVYDQASPFREGVAYFSIGEEYGLIDRQGNVVLELTDCDSISSFQEGLAYFSVDGRYGYMDKSGNVVIEPVYDDAGYFCGGLAVVMKGGFVGVIGKDGGEVLPLEYEDITLEDACIIARKEGRFYFFDRDGREVSSGDWDELWKGRDVFYLYKNGKEGLADRDGRIIRNPIYARLSAIPGKESAIVQNGNGAFGVLSYGGEVKVPFCYSDIRCVSDGGALNVSKADGLYVTDAVTGKTGYLSGEDLSVKIPVIYDNLWDFMDDRAAARLDGKAGVVRYDGTLEIPFSYDGIRLFSDGSTALRRGETWELKDREGNVIFAGECGFISEQGEGYAISTDDKTSFYDRQGREVVSDRDGYDLNMNRNRVFGAENSYVLSSGILLKTGREDGSDREEELLVNQITPRAGAFAEFMKNGSITTDTTGPEFTMDAERLRQCKRFGKLYRTEEEGELMLYFYAKPWVQPMFSESYSGFFVAKNGQAEQQITASECGGSMKGDRICFWYDTEKGALKPGTVGSYGGFGGMANGGEIYHLGRGKAILENSYMHSSENLADSEVRETYLVNDKAVSEEAYLAVENRYREYTPIGR